MNVITTAIMIEPMLETKLKKNEKIRKKKSIFGH